MKQGWKMKKLGELVNIRTGKLDSNAMVAGGKYPFFTCSKEIFAIDSYAFDCEAILLAGNNASGDFNVKHYKGKFNAYQRTYVITIKEEKELLYGYLNQQLISHLKKFKEQSVGANTKFLKIGMIQELEIPLPPLPEQQRIVAILDEAFAAIAKAKANAEQNLKNAKELFESYLQGVFEQRGDGWEEKTLGDVANTNGRIGWKGLTAKEYTEEGPLFISVHSLNYGDYVDFRDAFHISQSRYDESPEIMLQKDDILICKDGAGIGKLGIVPDLPDVATINSSLLLIRCKKEITSKYLYYNLLSPIFQSIVQSRLSGATTPHLYQRDIVTFPILLPKLTEQQSIVQKLDALSAQTKKLEAIYQQKIYDLEELKKSILQKAFSGELKTAEMLAV